jgi:hypothetical protein
MAAETQNRLPAAAENNLSLDLEQRNYFFQY